MARRRAAEKRQIHPDAKFKDVVLAKFINCVMVCGKKSIAERIVYGALAQVQTRSGRDPIEFFHEALNNIKPQAEVRSRRVGGATYQVPVEVRVERSEALAIRWLIQSASKRAEKTMMDKMANEIFDAAQNRGAAIKKREDTHRMADANKAFSHYRW